ncbi:hypothetical protein Ahy_B04g069271 [Arachis hypogaea]|uniref:UPF3 domain-containing protein n=1 Tax=Arachis hypogaea TaxID=3818 RepID=A0A444ZC56_ARAHY|nr:hypothetical protein Ahy_B04g069271 [Arachis hypogaea]
MKGALDRTKVVLRHLPPTISEAALLDQIDGTFAGRYNWVSFRPGKISQKHMSYSRAYVDFKKPEDVIEFAEFFNGHIFVNEKDSEYLEFLELLAKPVENLPSAEIQLEKREAERSGAAKDNPVITPLMDFVRQKRAAKGPRRSLSNGKVSRRAGTSSNGSSCSASSRRGSGKKRISTTMGSDLDSLIEQNNVTSSAKTIVGSTPLKQNQRHEGSARIIRSILSNKEMRQSQSARPQSEQTIPTSDLQKERQPPRPVHVQLILKGSNGTPENRIGMHDSRNSSERLEKRVRHKDRPDRGVWTNRSIGGDDSLSLSASSQVDHLEGFGKHFGRRGPTHLKDVDGYSVANEGKHHRRTSGSHGSHESEE